MKYQRKQVTFTEEDRKDRRLAMLEDDYASDTAYAAIPEKADPAIVHYWLVTELEAYARARLLKDTVLELIPDADVDSHSLFGVLWQPGVTK